MIEDVPKKELIVCCSIKVTVVDSLVIVCSSIANPLEIVVLIVSIPSVIVGTSQMQAEDFLYHTHPNVFDKPVPRLNSTL